MSSDRKAHQQLKSLIEPAADQERPIYQSQQIADIKERTTMIYLTSKACIVAKKKSSKACKHHIEFEAEVLAT